MALGRALIKVLVIDGGAPCNRQTPHSHNFLTRDGESPAATRAIAKMQLSRYSTIEFVEGSATSGSKTENGFEIGAAAGNIFTAGVLGDFCFALPLLPWIRSTE